MTTQELREKIDDLWESIQEEVGSSTMDLIVELVEKEKELERECNL